MVGASPVASLVSSLTGKAARVETFGASHGCVHSHSVRPGDLCRVHQADLLIYIDPSFDQAAYKAFKSSGPEKIVKISDFEGLYIRNNNWHFWMGLDQDEVFLKKISLILVEKFPDIKDIIYSNLSESLKKIEKLRLTKEEKLSSIDAFIILSDSLEYFLDSKKYKIEKLYDSQKSPRYPFKLEELIKKLDNPCIIGSEENRARFFEKLNIRPVFLETENFESDLFFEKYNEIIDEIYDICVVKNEKNG